MGIRVIRGTILGHSSTRITRSTYAKLLDDTVGREMEKAEIGSKHTYKLLYQIVA